MRPLLTILTVLLALPGAPAAAVWTPPPTSDQARAELYLPIARAAWPQSPCAGREVVHTGPDADVALAANDRITGEASIGMADPATCEIWLHTGRSAEEECDTLVHEAGHDAGYGHTGVAGDAQAPPGPWATIMYPDSRAHWPACVQATTPSSRYLAEQYVRQLLPHDGSGWTITCTPLHGRPTCRASRPGARDRRFRVLLSAGQVFGAAPYRA